MSGLKLAKGLVIPREAMLQRWAIMGMSGAGKSNTGVVLAEQMYDAEVPWCVVDPKGDWWGLRSGKQGGGSGGLDVPIFGGDHGDVPLYADGGKVMADAVAHELSHSILDVSGFEKRDMLRFLMDFIDQMYKVNRRPIVLILEEADEFIPQNKETPEEAKSVGKWSRAVKRGRTRGILTVVIALRNSELAKSVLNFSDTVIIHRTRAKLDREAVKGWVDQAEESSELLASLSALGDGEAWVSSPQKLGMTKKVQFYRRRTFDSGATPDLDVDRAQVTLASIDLAGIESRMQETIERAKEEDPAELRKRIAALERELREVPAPAPVEIPEPVEIKVPIFDGEAHHALSKMMDLRKGLLATAGEIEKTADGIGHDIDRAVELDEAARRARSAPKAAAPSTAIRQKSAVEPPTAARQTPSPPPDDRDLTGPQGRVLDAIAWWVEVGIEQPSKIQVGFIAGYRVGKRVGGTYGNVLGQLRAAGLIEYPSNGNVCFTPEGDIAATAPGIEKTTAGLQRAVMERLSGPEQRVLAGLIDRYPAAMRKQEAGELAGYTVGERVGGTFGNILGKLRSLALIDYPSPGEVVALPVLFLERR